MDYIYILMKDFEKGNFIKSELIFSSSIGFEHLYVKPGPLARTIYIYIIRLYKYIF